MQLARPVPIPRNRRGADCLRTFAAGAGPHRSCRMRLPSSGRNPSIFSSAIFFTVPAAARLRLPRPTGRSSFVAFKTTGTNPGYDVKDASGRVWSVKLGIEAQPEVTTSRILWAMGYPPAAAVLRPSVHAHGRRPRREDHRALPHRDRSVGSRRRLVVVRESVHECGAVRRARRRPVDLEQLGFEDAEQPPLPGHGRLGETAAAVHGARRRRVARPLEAVAVLQAARHARQPGQQERRRRIRAAGLHQEGRRRQASPSTIAA